MQLVINARDQVLARYGNQLAALGDGPARTDVSCPQPRRQQGANAGQARARQADRNQVRRVDKSMTTIRCMPTTLTYTLKAAATRRTSRGWRRAAR